MKADELMTADELLHKYFDVLAVEKLTTESYQLLQQYKSIVLNDVDNRQERQKAFAVLTDLSEKMTKELTLFWMEFDFEAYQKGLYDYMKNHVFIDVVLQSFLAKFRQYQNNNDFHQNKFLIKVDEEFLRNIIDVFKPSFYNNGRLVFVLINIVNEFILSNFYISEKIYKDYKKIFESINIYSSSNQEFNTFKKRLTVFIKQRELMKKYFGFDEEMNPSNLKIYQLLNRFREELFNSKNKIIMNYQSVKEILLLSQQDFNQVVLLWTEFFVDTQDFEETSSDVIPQSRYMIDELLVIFYRNKKALNR